MAAPPLKAAKPAYSIPNGATELDLSSKKIGDAATADLMEDLLKNHKTVKKLKLLDNRITDVGATSLARSLSTNTVLERLSLGRNQIGDDGCVQLARMLGENTTLRRLYLGDNPVTDKGATALARVLETKNSTLKELALSRCDLTDTCIPVWCDVIKKNETLLKLKISPAGNVGISSMGARLLLRAVRENDTLKSLWILAYSSRAGSFRPAALVSGLKGRRETVAIMQTEITNQLHRSPAERKKLKEATRQAPHADVSLEDMSTSPPNGSILALRGSNAAQSLPVFNRADIDAAHAAVGSKPPLPHSVTSVALHNGPSTSTGDLPHNGASSTIPIPPPLAPHHTNGRDGSPIPASKAEKAAKHHTRHNSDGSHTGHHRHATWQGDIALLEAPPATIPPAAAPVACNHPPEGPCMHGELLEQVAQLKQQLTSTESALHKKERRADRLKAELTDQRNLTTHLQGELEILRRELARVKEKCDSRGRKILQLRDQRSGSHSGHSPPMVPANPPAVQKNP